MTRSHETFSSNTRIPMPTERSFGIVFTSFFLLISLLPLLAGGNKIWPWTIGVALLFGIVTAFSPSLFRPLNRAWFAISLGISKVVTPVITGIIYFATVVPTSAVFKLRRKKLLEKKPDPKLSSYWHYRNPPGPPSDTMPRQF